jgi:putative peptidoglycan lipid II flippase
MKNRNLFKVAGLIALVTIFSKIVGFARDMVIAKVYGATYVSDAYFYAYQFPALSIILLGGLGGPFHTATVAIFTKIIPDLDKKPDEYVQKVFNSFVTVTSLFFLVLTVLFFFFSGQIVHFIASDATPELKNLASVHLKIMSPILFIGGIIGIFYGISNVYREFLFTSLSPTIQSIFIITFLLFAQGDKLGYGLAYATLIGSIGQFALQIPVFLKTGIVFKPIFYFKDENIKRIGEILFPAMLGTTIGQINIYVDMFFASRLNEGAWSAIGYANRIFQFPVGVMITAFLVPLFPMFSTFVAKQDFDSLRKYFKKGLISLWFIAFPILALILMFSFDGVKLLFQRGAFNVNDTLMVSEALFYISLSIIPYVARDTLTRVFYSFDDSRTPFMIAIFSIFVKFIMNMLLVGPLGVGGIMLSTTIVTTVNAILLSLLIRKKIGLSYLKLVSPVSKIFFATLLMSVVLGLFNFIFSKVLPDTFVFLALKLSLFSIIACVVYILFSLKLKLQPAQNLVDRAKSFIMSRIN